MVPSTWLAIKIVTSGRKDLTNIKITWKEEVRIWKWLVSQSAFRQRRKERRYLKHCTKEKFCSRFLIRKALCKVGVDSKYCVIHRIRRPHKLLPASVEIQ
ncbi:hypothetical protein TNCV_2176751 [Trichonephila clavipes]|uniref:Uncharacterized protein n=1 Tax=Trichonephila clavipes TaxID=2585209 RepID=A0A8X7B8Q0_TRICX|nr:hypothetical protein TNCV_2176751 [Trichonephila clavipes]